MTMAPTGVLQEIAETTPSADRKTVRPAASAPVRLGSVMRREGNDSREEASRLADGDVSRCSVRDGCCRQVMWFATLLPDYQRRSAIAASSRIPIPTITSSPAKK